MRLIGLSMFGLVLLGQDPYEKMRAAMEASAARQLESVEKQRVSVRKQSGDAAWRACEPVPAAQIGPVVEEISKREGLTPDLLRAVIQKESSFLPCAVSAKGAQGLMQLMPDTAAELGVLDPFDPADNVAGGARYLRRLLNRYGGDLPLALGAYNAGPGRIDTLGALPSFPETADYVEGIMRALGGERRDGPR